MKDKLPIIIILGLAMALLLTFNFDALLVGNRPALATASVGYVNVPAAAFMPIDNSIDFYQGGNTIYLTSPTTGGWFSAPVSLPDGATLNKMTHYWYDDYDIYDSQCQLMAVDTDQATYIRQPFQIWFPRRAMAAMTPATQPIFPSRPSTIRDIFIKSSAFYIENTQILFL
jgi:hypothetical protein